MSVSFNSVSRLAVAFLMASMAVGAVQPAFSQVAAHQPAETAQPVKAVLPQAQSATRTIEWQDSASRHVVTVAMDDEDLARLQANPVSDALQGEALLDALRDHGAVLSDTFAAGGARIPAVQEYDLNTGHLTLREHYSDGRLQNPAPDVPAIVHYDATTGNKFIVEFFDAGKRQNPAPGVAAQQYFDPARPGGQPYILLFYKADKLDDPAPNVPARQYYDVKNHRLLHFAHYQTGAYLDPPSGDPAWQTFDAATGHRTAAERYQRGRPQDSPSGDAAWKRFDAATGNIVEQKHYQTRKLQDAPGGEPAWMKFDPLTRRVIFAERFQNGESQGVLSPAELETLNTRRSAAPQNPSP